MKGTVKNVESTLGQKMEFSLLMNTSRLEAWLHFCSLAFSRCCRTLSGQTIFHSGSLNRAYSHYCKLDNRAKYIFEMACKVDAVELLIFYIPSSWLSQMWRGRHPREIQLQSAHSVTWIAGSLMSASGNNHQTHSDLPATDAELARWFMDLKLFRAGRAVMLWCQVGTLGVEEGCFPASSGTIYMKSHIRDEVWSALAGIHFSSAN